MAPNFDFFASLLCDEDTSTVFDEIDDFEESYEMLEEPLINSRYSRNHNPINHYNYTNEWLPLLSDECLALMVQNECHHLPNSDYVDKLKKGELDLGERMEAIDWIEKVREYYGFGALSTYLSLNYLDRFLSSYDLPERDWTMQLLALACLSLATKIDEHEIPPILDLQVNGPRFVFELETVQRMELLILSTLKWRMQAITPFSFIDYFLFKVNDDQVPKETSIFQSIQLILSTVKGTEFLGFRSSEIAAAVAILVVGKTQTFLTDDAASVQIQHVEKERVIKCVKMIQELSLDKGTTTTTNASISMPKSPIGVLEAICLSSKTDETTNAISCPNTSHDSPDAKRRKENKNFEG